MIRYVNEFSFFGNFIKRILPSFIKPIEIGLREPDTKMNPFSSIIYMLSSFIMFTVIFVTWKNYDVPVSTDHDTELIETDINCSIY